MAVTSYSYLAVFTRSKTLLPRTTISSTITRSLYLYHNKAAWKSIRYATGGTDDTMCIGLCFLCRQWCAKSNQGNECCGRLLPWLMQISWLCNHAVADMACKSEHLGDALALASLIRLTWCNVEVPTGCLPCTNGLAVLCNADCLIRMWYLGASDDLL